MQSINFELLVESPVSLAGARAVRNQLDSFLAFLTEKMTDEREDRSDTASLTYAIVRGWRRQLDGKIRELEVLNDEKRKAAARRDSVPVRQARGLRR